ncbi:tryptophan synthase beta subunit-like PLP-dependent enzyme [Xylariaceae sp. FL1651]|nr:tryptophan synthase beta subunit-like PLP-dependent enzyme [Xylariaceae sp. FL1651]
MADPSTSPPLTRTSVLEARELIREFVHHTPTLTNATLTRLASTPAPAPLPASTSTEAGAGGEDNTGRRPANPKIRLYFKCENLQRIGAFKIRGAFHAIERLKREPGWEAGGGRERGVVTHSSGVDKAKWHAPLVWEEWEGEVETYILATCLKISTGVQLVNLNAAAVYRSVIHQHILVDLLSERRREAANIYTIGNHAQALAVAARTNGIPAYIVMPSIAPAPKIAATKGYGANVVFSGSTSVEREAVTMKVIEETGARLIPPYDHPDIVLGQGTLGLELQEDARDMIAAAASPNPAAGGQEARQVKCSFKAPVTNPELPGSKKNPGLDAILAPCGGGGMLAGVALSCEGTGIRVFGCEPSFEGADDAKRGYEAGVRVEAVSTLTVADGLRTPLGRVPWGVIYERRLVAGFYSVSEDEIVAALKLVYERFKMVIEPSAAVPLAVALFNEDFRALVEREAGEEGWDVGIVFSGGNVSLEALGKLFAPKGST